MVLNGTAAETALLDQTLIGLGLQYDPTKPAVANIYVEPQVVLHPAPINLPPVK